MPKKQSSSREEISIELHGKTYGGWYIANTSTIEVYTPQGGYKSTNLGRGKNPLATAKMLLAELANEGKA